MKTLILNAKIVNEGKVEEKDVLIAHERIELIGNDLQNKVADKVIDASNLLLFPGVIDDQVHFREPGLTHKGNIATESGAAVAGGVTSFMEMPNTNPPVFTHDLLEAKYEIAHQTSRANYSFYMGTSNDNLEEVLKTDLTRVCGLKIFMGSSTGNLLVDRPQTLESIFSRFRGLIATHCEDEKTVLDNLAAAKQKYGVDAPTEIHPIIRNHEACYKSSSFAVELAKKHGTRLHVLHISTAKEVSLFDNEIALANKKITAEACIHHLWFTDKDYATLGNKIKWNPAIKTETDREAIWKGVLNNNIDVIATDHAPHTIEEKNQSFFNAPSGGPLIQHSLLAMLQASANGRLPYEKVVEKMCHNPAILFRIKDRGFIREGYFADLVLVDPNKPFKVLETNILAKCKWSPFEGMEFKNSIHTTFVNGIIAYQNGKLGQKASKRLEFVVA